MSKLTARQASIQAHVEKYYPTYQVEVIEAGKVTTLKVSNPARPYAGALYVNGMVNPYTKRENNTAGESYPGQSYAAVPLNQVASRLREMA